MSPPEHEKGPSLDTPMPQAVSDNFHASYHIQNVLPYADLSRQRCHSCMVCGKSADQINKKRSTGIWQDLRPRVSLLISPPCEEKPIQMVLTPAAYFSQHPQCRRLPPVTALGSRQLHKGRRQLPAHFPFISQKNNQTNFLHYFVALNLLHLLTLLNFLIYI